MLGSPTYSADRPGIRNLFDILAATLNAEQARAHAAQRALALQKTRLAQSGLLEDHTRLAAVAADTASSHAGADIDAMIEEHLTVARGLAQTPSTSAADLVADFKDCSLLAFKTAISDALVREIGPIREKTRALLADKPAVDAVLARGADKAHARAEQMMGKVRKAMGFVGRT